jgi:predicted nuclease of predicted toxin-antitoxin system
VRLLLDEMYSPEIARILRGRGHDVDSAAERAELRAAADDAVVETAQREGRVVVTNNVRDFAPLAWRVMQARAPFCGIVFTSDRSLPRSTTTVGRFADLLETLLAQHGGDDVLAAGIAWLTQPD